MASPLKRCSHCERDLPRIEFYRCKKSSDGLTGACRECFSAYKRGEIETLGAARVFCLVCGNLPHRVRGPRCRRCGLEYADDVLPTIDEIGARRKVVNWP